MGWGDEIMVTAQARRLQIKDPRPVAVRDRNGWARWHAAWENNPRIARPGAHTQHQVQWLDNYSGHRPYLNYRRFNNAVKAEPYVYTDWRVEPGEIYLSAREKDLSTLAAGAVLLEPHIKPGASPNKDWGWERWVDLARRLRDLRLVQMGPSSLDLLPGVQWIRTEDIRAAAGVLAGARLLIAPEGGLHHAAAALGVRAVVIFGGFISPMTTGYELHTNLFRGDRPCGMRVPCRHCREAMTTITPEEVEAAARAELRKLEEVAA